MARPKAPIALSNRPRESYRSGEAQVVVGIAEVRLRRNRAVERGERLFPPVPDRRCRAPPQVAVILGHVWVDGDCPADQLDRRVEIARLAGQNAEKMQGIGVVGMPARTWR